MFVVVMLPSEFLEFCQAYLTGGCGLEGPHDFPQRRGVINRAYGRLPIGCRDTIYRVLDCCLVVGA